MKSVPGNNLEYMDEEFSCLLKEVTKRSIDAIIPVKRKGAAVLKRVMLTKAVPELADIQVLDSEQITEDDIRERRVAIFDDAIYSGQTVKTILDRVKRFKPKYVVIVTLVLYSNSGVRAFFKHKVKIKGFREWMKKRQRYYFQLGFPLDPDHLVINCETQIIGQRDLVNLFKNSGKRIGSPQVVSPAKGSEMITIEVNPSRLVRSLGWSLPSFIERIDACKVRLYFDKNFISIVPIVNPIVLTSRKEGECEKNTPNCFLMIFPTKTNLNVDRKVCRDCVTFYCSLRLAELFLEKLREQAQKHDISVLFSSVTWDEMERTYEAFSKLLQIPKLTR